MVRGAFRTGDSESRTVTIESCVIVDAGLVFRSSSPLIGQSSSVVVDGVEGVEGVDAEVEVDMAGVESVVSLLVSDGC
jgi:hypothetical protein